MHETTSSPVEKITMGAFAGSDLPNKIVTLRDNQSQAIWSNPGATVKIDEAGIMFDPVTYSVHTGVVFRLAGKNDVQDVVYTPDVAVVITRDSYQANPMSVRAYTRDGTDKNYQMPEVCKIGENLNLLSSPEERRLDAVIELAGVDAEYQVDVPVVADLLNGMTGRIGNPFSQVPIVSRPNQSPMTGLIAEASRRVDLAVGRLGIVAIQSDGVVIK